MDIGGAAPDPGRCHCGGIYVRKMKAPQLAMAQEETVRAASQVMLHSRMPSGREKSAV